MDASRAQVALLIDVETVLPGAAPAESAGALASALVRYASAVGRVALARAYGAWAETGHAREVQAAHVVPVLVPAAPAGGRRTPVRLSADALESLFVGGEPDAFVLATGDAALLPLVQAIRADGSAVVLVAPESAEVADLRAEADACHSVEEVLAGAVGRPASPRAGRDDEDEGAGPPRRVEVAPHRRAPFRDHREGERERAVVRSAPADFSSYDWGPFVRLIDELEHRLPFVGVRYLVNKVLGPRNCGIDEPRQKRDLINHAVDEGLIEMYPVGNLGERADPVTACRLDRKNPTVVGILGPDTVAPVVREASSERDLERAGVAGEGSEGGESEDLD
jgi:hypothetical protein